MITRDGIRLMSSVAVVLVPFLVGCGNSSVGDGGSTGTEVSAIVGSVQDCDGNPVPDAKVRLRPANFLSDSVASKSYMATHSIFDTVTGSNGTFKFSELLPDSYTIEVICNDTLGSLAGLRIGQQSSQVALLPLIAAPLALVSGIAQINYGENLFIRVQAYGLERATWTDGAGNFSLLLPCVYPVGIHRLHIGARMTDDTMQSGEFDGLDVLLDVVPGEQRAAGSFFLRPPPPPPCIDGACDSAVLRFVLDATGNETVRLDSVAVVEGGRIVELHLRGMRMNGMVPFDLNRLTGLRLLDMGHTGLLCIFPDMGRMTNLEVILLDGNSIPFFATRAGDLKKLRELDLSGNELTALPPSIVDCMNITSLNLSNNRLCAVDSATAAWSDRFDPDWRTDQRCQ